MNRGTILDLTNLRGGGCHLYIYSIGLGEFYGSTMLIIPTIKSFTGAMKFDIFKL
jgi:altronate dehydratase